MASIDLPATGKDTKITLSLNGALKAIQDQCEKFTAKPIYDEIIHKPLGQSGSKVDKEFVGWEGTVVVRASRRDMDDMINQINAFRKARVAYSSAIVDTTFYRDGVPITHTYPDVEFEYDTSKSRGEANMVTLAWKTGKDRIAA